MDNYRGGWIEIIAGGMFSGKSEELIRRLRRAVIARQRVQVFKPLIDDRFNTEDIVSRDDRRLKATAVATSAELLTNVEIGMQVVGIDEIQFFDAGVVDVLARVDEVSLARLQRLFAINVFGSFLCAREAVKRMSNRHGGAGGAIVNLSSVAAKLGGPGWYVDYAASKGAIDTFTVGLAREVAAEGIRVNAVRPGIIDTEIHASGGQPDRVKSSTATIPMQRPGTADEVAAAIVWLLSDEARYSTGAIVDVTGGR